MGGWSLVFEPPHLGPLSLAWVVGLVAIVLLFAAARRYHDPMGALPRGVRWIAIGCRVLAILLLLFLFVRPVALFTFTRYDKPVLSILIDHSASMSIRDVAESAKAKPISRADAVKNAIVQTRALRDQLAERFDIRLSAIGGAALTDWITATEGRWTNIGQSITDSAESDRPACMLLISDGAENLWPAERVLDSAAAIASSGTELHAVCAGSELPPADVCRVRVRNLTAPRQVPLGGVIEVQADVVAFGCAGMPVRIEFQWNDSTLSHEIWTPTQPREEKHVQFTHTGDEPGFHQAEVTASIRPRRDTSDKSPATATARHGLNASSGQFVHVMDDKVRVLWIESHPRHESAFAWRALAGDARLAVTRMWLSQPVEGAWTNPLPKDMDEWRKYHLVVIGDVESSLLPERRLAELARAVSEIGTGVVVLGGSRGMVALRGPGMSDVSPTAPQRNAVVPATSGVKLTDAGMQWLTTAMTATTQSAAAPEKRVQAPSTAGLFKLMQTPQTVLPLGSPKPTAQVLATSVDEAPLAATIRAGGGRVLALGLSETWRWSMSSDDGPALHAGFWRQLVFTTARQQLSAYIRADLPRYELPALQSTGGRVRIEARIADPFTGKPPPGLSARAAVRRRSTNRDAAPTAQEAAQPISLRAEGDLLIGECQIRQVGGYELSLESGPMDPPTRSQGAREQPLAASSPVHATGRFSVIDVDAELDAPEANPDLLRAIADRSPDGSGRFATIDQFDSCLKHLLTTDRRRAVPGTTRYPLAELARRPVLALLCACFLLEWIIRKRNGVI